MLPFHSSIFDFCSKVHITYTIDYVKNKNSQIAHSLNHKREDTKYIFVLSGTVTERQKKKSISMHWSTHWSLSQMGYSWVGLCMNIVVLPDIFVCEYTLYTIWLDFVTLGTFALLFSLLLLVQERRRESMSSLSSLSSYIRWWVNGFWWCIRRRLARRFPTHVS